MGNAPSTINPDEDLVKRVDDLLFQVGDLQSKVNSMSSSVANIADLRKTLDAVIVNQNDMVNTVNDMNTNLINVITKQDTIVKQVNEITNVQNNMITKQDTIVKQVNEITNVQNNMITQQDTIVQQVNTITNAASDSQTDTLATRLSQTERDFVDLFNKYSEMNLYVNTLPTTSMLATEFADIDTAIAEVSQKSPLGFWIGYGRGGTVGGQIVFSQRTISSRGSFIGTPGGSGVPILETGVYYVQVVTSFRGGQEGSRVTWSLHPLGVTSSYSRLGPNANFGECMSVGDVLSDIFEVKTTPSYASVTASYWVPNQGAAGATVYETGNSHMIIIRIGDVK